MNRHFAYHIEELKTFLRSPDWARYFALVMLGIPVGLIFVFVLNTLQFWLLTFGLSKAAIGMFSLGILPNTLKFLWAPFLETLKFPILSYFLPNRHAWSIGLCLALCLVFIGISTLHPNENIPLAFSLIAFSSILTATLEINLDAIRIDLVPPKKQGYAASFYAFGYRLGTILGAAGVLYVSAYFSWSAAFMFVVGTLFLSALIILVCALAFREPVFKSNDESTKHTTNWKKLAEPFLTFTNSRHWLVLFIFIFTFRMGDNFINNMVNIFYKEIGFTELDIANVVKFFGVFFTILGTFVSGHLVMRYGGLNALLISGTLHVITNFMYLIQSHIGYNFPFFYAAVILENTTGGMATTAFVAYLSNLCKKPFTFSHFALFSSIWYMSTACSGFGGLMAEYLPWPTFFSICIVVGIFPLGLIFYLKNSPPETEIYPESIDKK